MKKEVLVHVTVVITDTPTYLIDTDDVDIDDPQQLQNYIEQQVEESGDIPEMCKYAATDGMYDAVTVEICEIEDIN